MHAEREILAKLREQRIAEASNPDSHKCYPTQCDGDIDFKCTECGHTADYHLFFLDKQNEELVVCPSCGASFDPASQVPSQE